MRPIAVSATSDRQAIGVAPAAGWNTESYQRRYDNPVLAARDNPVSTFGVDVDTASYANVRRFIEGGQLPPPDAVRLEELVNYFRYQQPEPAGEHPVGLLAEVGPCPWRPEHRLVRIGLKARTLSGEAVPPRNLAFLIDVSGSMGEPRKLPLVRRSLELLVEQLGERDRIAHGGLCRQLRDGAAAHARARTSRASARPSSAWRRAARPTAGRASSWHTG